MKRIIHFVPLAFLLCLSGWLGAQTLTQVEYFFDTDPGEGKGTVINITTPADSVNQNMNIPIGNLSAGFHRLFMRAKYSDGTWGLQQPAEFIVNTTIDTGAGPKISAAEYFFDTDPGIGNGTPLTVSTSADSVNITQGISVGSLNPGFHHLYTRFRYSNGTWGLQDGRDFNVLPVANAPSPQISAAEYFFDTDPGLGKGTPVAINTPSDSVNLTQSIPATGLSAGFHHLYTRFQYTNGSWGLQDGRDFYVANQLGTDTSPPINYVEYFVDSDPGVGKGTGIGITPAADSVNVSTGIAMEGLSHGKHNLYARFRYTNGTWGLYQPFGNSQFSVCIPPVDTIIALGPTTYCKGSSVTLSSDTSHIWTYQWQLNGANLTSDTLTTLVITDSSGIYDMVVTDTTGCSGTSDSITVTIPSASLSWASLVESNQLNVSGSDTGLCEGQTITFTGGNPTGGTYTGDSVNNNSLTGYAPTGVDVITYTVTVDDCVVSASDNINLEACTGINQVNLEYAVSLYPNPAGDVLMVQSNFFASSEVAPVMYDVAGRLVASISFTRQTDKFTFNTSSLPAGVYFIKLNMAGNEVVKRFVKVD